MSAGPEPPLSNFHDPPAGYPWEVPPAPRMRPIPLPPVDPQYDNRGHIGGDGYNDGGGDNSLRGGTCKWADGLTQGVASVSLASAKFNPTDNKNRSQVGGAFYPNQKPCFIITMALSARPPPRSLTNGTLSLSTYIIFWPLFAVCDLLVLITYLPAITNYSYFTFFL